MDCDLRYGRWNKSYYAEVDLVIVLSQQLKGN